MRLNRDLVLCYLAAARALRCEQLSEHLAGSTGAAAVPFDFLDAFSSSGIVGVRAVKEVRPRSDPVMHERCSPQQTPRVVTTNKSCDAICSAGSTVGSQLARPWPPRRSAQGGYEWPCAPPEPMSADPCAQRKQAWPSLHPVLQVGAQEAQMRLRVCLNDLSSECAELIARNCSDNGVAHKRSDAVDAPVNASANAAPWDGVHSVTRLSADVLLHQRGFDAVHLDPYGSCVPHLDSAMANAPHGGFIFATATGPRPLHHPEQRV